MRSPKTLFIVVGLLFAIFSSFAVAIPAQAQSGGLAYYVSPSGSDTSNTGTSPGSPFRTIQHAANQTLPGDTVYIMNGTYGAAHRQGVAIITRSGSADAYITYRAYPGHRPRLHVTAPSDPSDTDGVWNVLLVAGASYIRIEDLEVMGDSAVLTELHAEQYSTTSNPVYNTNCVFIRPYRTNDNATTDDASELPDGTRPHHIVVRNVYVHHCPGAGIAAEFADYITFENNVVHSTSWYTVYATSGISILYPVDFDTNTGYKNIVRGNMSYNNETFIFWFEENRISDGNGIIIDSTLHNDSMQKDPYHGTPYGGRTLVANNIAFNNGGSGVSAFRSGNVDVVNNTAYFNSRSPDLNYASIASSYSNGVNVINNISYMRAGEPSTTNTNNTNVVYDYNIYYNGLTPVVMGPNDLIADPQFAYASTDPTVANFRLVGAAPGVDSGAATLAPVDDFEGKGRPQAGQPDRGAFERGLFNAVGNPGFEATTGLSPWAAWANFTTEAGQGLNGSSAARFGGSGLTGGTVQRLNALPNATYTVSAYGRTLNSQWAAIGYAFFAQSGAQIGSEVYSSSFPSGSYAQRSLSFTAPANAASVEVRVWTNSGTLYLDDVQLTPNLAQNGGFESGVLTPWESYGNFSAQNDPANAAAGSWLGVAGATGQSGGGAQQIIVRPGEQYLLSAYGKRVSGTWGSVGLAFYDGAGVQIGADQYLPSFGTSGAQQSASFTAPVHAVFARVLVWANGVLHVDTIAVSPE